MASSSESSDISKNASLKKAMSKQQSNHGSNEIRESSVDTFSTEFDLVDLQAREPNREKYFLGFRLNKQNINQMWRWDTLEDVNF